MNRQQRVFMDLGLDVRPLALALARVQAELAITEAHRRVRAYRAEALLSAITAGK
jgi:hypothetical protein